MSLIKVAVLIAGLAATAPAGTIVAIGAAAGAGSLTGVPSVSTTAPADDNASTIVNQILNLSKSVTGTGFLDIPFTVASSNGTTEYYLEEIVANASGIAWIAYRFELGFGLGPSFATSGLFDFLDFDAPDRDPAPASSVFTTLVHGANVLRFSDALQNDGEASTFRFSIDVPDRADIPQSYWTADGYTFTLRQIAEEGRSDPIVPEPAGLALITAGALALLALKRRV